MGLVDEGIQTYERYFGKRRNLGTVGSRSRSTNKLIICKRMEKKVDRYNRGKGGSNVQRTGEGGGKGKSTFSLT